MMRVLAATRVAHLVGDFDREPAYRGLAEALRALIADGRIPVGVRLPSERELTDALGVSRTTVTRAYADLRERGFLVSRQGSGSMAALPQGLGRTGDALLTVGDPTDDQTDLTCAAAAPVPGILVAYQRAMAVLPDYLCGSGYYPTGLPELRAEIAAWFGRRGLPTRAEQVMVVPGAQAGVAVSAHTLLEHGTRTLVESPTYPNSATMLKRAGARVFSAHVDRLDDGADELVHTIGQVRPGLAYLIPDFHNPTGRLLSSEDRAGVAAALRRVKATPIIDESMVELGLDRPAPEPFAVHAPEAVTVGSLSKPFWGGLRVGWVRVPEGRMDQLVATRLTLDLGVPLMEQLVALELLRDGDTALAHRREQLRRSRDAALGALGEHLPEWKVRRPAGGLALWCELPEPRSTELVALAAKAGVTLVPGPSFAPEGGLDRFLRLPYTQPADVLAEAIGRVGEAWRSLPDRPARRRRRDEPSPPTLVA